MLKKMKANSYLAGKSVQEVVESRLWKLRQNPSSGMYHRKEKGFRE